MLCVCHISGSSALTGKTYQLAVNRIVVFRHIRCPVAAVTLLFGLYYVLNLHYPESADITLEFIQRYSGIDVIVSHLLVSKMLMKAENVFNSLEGANLCHSPGEAIRDY